VPLVPGAVPLVPGAELTTYSFSVPRARARKRKRGNVLLSTIMKAAVVLAVFIAGKTSQAFIATPITAAAVAEQATGAVSRSSVGAGDDNQCGYGWTGVARRHSNGGMCMATSSELDQSAE